MVMLGAALSLLGVTVPRGPIWRGRMLMGIRAEARAHVERDAERLDDDDPFEEHAPAAET